MSAAKQNGAAQLSIGASAPDSSLSGTVVLSVPKSMIESSDGDVVFTVDGKKVGTATAEDPEIVVYTDVLSNDDHEFAASVLGSNGETQVVKVTANVNNSAMHSFKVWLSSTVVRLSIAIVLLIAAGIVARKRIREIIERRKILEPTPATIEPTTGFTGLGPWNGSYGAIAAVALVLVSGVILVTPGTAVFSGNTTFVVEPEIAQITTSFLTAVEPDTTYVVLTKTVQPPTPPTPSPTPPIPDPNPPAPSPTPNPPGTNTSYAQNLAMINAVTAYRNTNEDNSPYKNTASAQLPVESLYGPRTDYLNNPAGNPEQDFPVDEGGQFREGCEFSHFAYDDPLVYPNQPGKAHLHMFFGNTDTNAYSSYNTLLNTGSSTCNGMELNRTGYWAPAMFDSNGNVRIPERIVVYYKGEGLANSKAEPYPEGAAIIGNQNINTLDNGRGGAAGKFNFTCSDQYSGASEPNSNLMPACDGNRFLDAYGVTDDPHVVLEMNVKFPQCWTGGNPADYANSYHVPTEGSWYFSKCDDHTLTNLEYFINYRVNIGENTAGWYLSSDVNPQTLVKDKQSGASTHADWWGGWHRNTMQMWIDNCVKFRTSEPSGCGFGYLTNGGPDGNNPLPGPALKYRKQYTGPEKVSAQTLFKDLCKSTRQYTGPESAAYCTP